MHRRTKDDVAILDGCDVDAVLVEPLEERQEVRAGLVALLGDALLVVRDAQRRLYYGIDRWAEWQLDGVEVDTKK